MTARSFQVATRYTYSVLRMIWRGYVFLTEWASPAAFAYLWLCE